jgi:hypothetical protein
LIAGFGPALVVIAVYFLWFRRSDKAQARERRQAMLAEGAPQPDFSGLDNPAPLPASSSEPATRAPE